MNPIDSFAKEKRQQYIQYLSFTAGTCVIFTIVLIFISLELWVSGFLKYECEIKNITYPDNIPKINITNNNWNECDCGNYCVEWEPCIKLYATPSIAQSDSVYEVKNEYFHPRTCTFMDNNCESYFNSNNYSMVLYEVKKKVSSYVNSSIECYWNGEDDYVYLDYNKINLYFAFALILIIVIGIMVTFFILCKKIPVIPNNDVKENSINNVV